MKIALENIFIALSAAVLLSVSCAPDIKPEGSAGTDTEETVVPEGMMIKQFTASLADLTKVSLVGSSVKFSESDKIAVYDGSLKNEFSVKSVESGLATFEGFVTEGSVDFTAVYPYSAASDVQPTDGRCSFSVPAIQKVDSSVPTDPDAVVGLAVADEVGHFHFRNAVSVITVSVPDGAKKVTLSSNESIPLAGVCSAKPGDMPEGASETEVILLPASESGQFTAGKYNICTVPAHLQAGLSIKVENDIQQAIVKIDGPLELPRTSLVDLTSSFKDMPWIRNFISSAKELRDFAAIAQDYESSDIVGLSSDIDLASEDWTPFNLKCTLDGLGHRITGINVSSADYRTGFIGTIESGAVLKNLVLGSSDGSSYDGTSSVTYTGTGGAYLGGVVSDCQGTIENVKSFVSVNYKSTAAADCHIGGISGNVGGSGIITGCEFAGTMTLSNNTSSSGTQKAGGITGRMHNGLADAQTVKNCSFTGVITNEDSRMEGVGGIVGHHQGGSIVGCTSSGRINMNYKGSFGYVGGVVGYYQPLSPATYGITVSGCTNSTVIDSPQRVFAASGIVAYAQRAATAPLTISGCTNNGDICLKTAPSAMTCLGGIIGYSQKIGEGTSDMLSVKLTVKDNTNNGKIECNIDGTAQDLYIGGICGYISGTVAFAISGNTNNGNVTMNGKLVRTGGIVGWLQSPDATVSGNVNTGSITQTNTNVISASGGIIGFSDKSLSMSGNSNEGDVKINCSTASDNYAAGLIGQFAGSSDTNNRNILTITNDKSTGSISSPGRAGVIFSALAGGTYVNCTLSNVGVGGTVNGTEVTSENYSNYLWSYMNSTYHTVTGANTCEYISK